MRFSTAHVARKPKSSDNRSRLRTPATDPTSVRAREALIVALEAECARLADAIARGGRLDVLLRTLEDRQNRLAALRAEREAAQAIERPVFDRAGTERRLRCLLDDWRGLLCRDVVSGRGVLRALLVGPLKFTPVIEKRRRGYRFEGAIALDRLVSGLMSFPTLMVSSTGLGPVASAHTLVVSGAPRARRH